MKKVVFLLLCMVVLFFSQAESKIRFSSDQSKIIDQGLATELSGNVKIVAPNIYISSEKAISKKNRSVIESKKNVYIKYSSDTWNLEGWCDNLIYLSENNMFTMTGNVKTKYITIEDGIENVVEIYADEIIIDNSPAKKIIFNNNVKIERNGIFVNSSKAVYYRGEDIIKFTGDPKAYSTGKDVSTEYSGTQIDLFIKEEKIKVKGNAYSRIRFKDELKM